MKTHRILLLFLLLSGAAGMMHAEVPDWFVNPPVEKGTLFGIGVGVSRFEALVFAAADIAMQKEASITTTSRGNYMEVHQSTSWHSPYFSLRWTQDDYVFEDTLNRSGGKITLTIFPDPRGAPTVLEGTFTESLEPETRGIAWTITGDATRDDAIQAITRSFGSSPDFDTPLTVTELELDTDAVDSRWYALLGTPSTAPSE